MKLLLYCSAVFIAGRGASWAGTLYKQEALIRFSPDLSFTVSLQSNTILPTGNDTPTTTSVPEPPAFFAVGLGLVILGVRRK
jgi:hypothetical protein